MEGSSLLGLLLAALEAILERCSALAGSWAQQYPCGPVAGALQGSPDAFVARHTAISGYPPPGPPAKYVLYDHIPLSSSSETQQGGRNSRTRRGGSLRACGRCSVSRTPSRVRAPRRGPSGASGDLSWRQVPSRPTRRVLCPQIGSFLYALMYKPHPREYIRQRQGTLARSCRTPPPRPALPLFLLARVVAAPRFRQLVEAAPPLSIPLLSPAFVGLPGLSPLPPLAIALLAAVRHAALPGGQSKRLR